VPEGATNAERLRPKLRVTSTTFEFDVEDEGNFSAGSARDRKVESTGRVEPVPPCWVATC